MNRQICPGCGCRFGKALNVCPHCIRTITPQVSSGRPVVVDTEAPREIAEQVIELPATENQEAARLRMRLRRVLKEMEREKLIELLLE